MRRAGLGPVSAASGALWAGYDAQAQDFVYVYRYASKSDAAARARVLADEEVATAGRYLVNQPIAAYPGSPVASVVVCLGGRAPHVKGKHGGSFTF